MLNQKNLRESFGDPPGGGISDPPGGNLFGATPIGN